MCCRFPRDHIVKHWTGGHEPDRIKEYPLSTCRTMLFLNKIGWRFLVVHIEPDFVLYSKSMEIGSLFPNKDTYTMVYYT